jgi:hypothetical protein
MKNTLNRLEQCCPTLSPFATCGDSLFKCGDRKFFQKLQFSRKVQQRAVFTAYFSELWRQQRDCCHKSGECGDRNILVGHGWSRAVFLNRCSVSSLQVHCRFTSTFLRWRYGDFWSQRLRFCRKKFNRSATSSFF